MNAQIENNFKYHPPSDGDPEKHARLRDKAKEFALLVDELLPTEAGRERATSITNIEQAMMWACAGVVRYPKKNS